ncbi:hypothetical protein BRADI_1g57149v3, partial [Brachypodium distachyon]
PSLSPPPELLEELIEEVFLRLPLKEPEHLVCASALCKPWHHLLADRGFRRRYRKFHEKPPVLGFIFIPTSSFIPSQADRPLGWDVFDARHGRALSFTTNKFSSPLEARDFGLAVWDPTTDEQHHLPPSFFSLEDYKYFMVAMLCAVEGCDHCSCQGGPFHVVAESTKKGIISARRYSSETGAWREPTSVHHYNARAISMTSVLIGSALYFSAMPNHVIKCELGAAPVTDTVHMAMGTLVTTEDGGLGFASVHDTILIMWSRETGAEGWAQHNVIDLKTMLPDDDSIYMVDLKSRQVQKMVDIDDCERVYPYMSFYIPAMEAVSTGQGQQVGVSSVHKI